jgi:hypothetical protein
LKKKVPILCLLSSPLEAKGGLGKREGLCHMGGQIHPFRKALTAASARVEADSFTRML